MPEAIGELPEVIVWVLLGGGGAGLWFLLRHAMLHYLGQSLATKDELNGMGARVTAVQTLATQTIDRLDDDILPRLGTLESANEYGWEPLTKELADLRQRQEERDRRDAEWREQLGRMIGGLEGTLREFIRNHGPTGGH